MRKFTKIGAIVGISLAFALIGGAAANATEPVFVPYETNQTWYAPSPATVAAPFAVAQHTAVLTCGGIKQYDEYTIKTADMDAHYKALLATATLNSAAEDAEFSPHNYTVTALPDCPPPVVPTATFPDGSQTCNTYTLPVLDAALLKYPLADQNDQNSRYTAGTHPLTGTVTVVAHTLASANVVQASHTYTFTATDCPVVVTEPPVKTTPVAAVQKKPELAQTGNDLLKVLLFIGAGAFLTAGGIVLRVRG